MLDIAQKQIIPAIIAYNKQLTEAALLKQNVLKGANIPELALANKLNDILGLACVGAESLQSALAAMQKKDGWPKLADYCHKTLIPAMAVLRAGCDEAEMIVSKSFWPFPTYGDLLGSV
jgi:glutamine synthetase